MMKFTNVTVQKASSIQKLASNLAAIEFIIGFRRRNRQVFNVITTVLVGIILIILIVFVGTMFPRYTSLAFIVGAVALGTLIVLIWRPNRSNKRKTRTAVLCVIIMYLAVIIGGASKVQGPYDSLQRTIASTGQPVQLIEKSYAEHLKVMLAEPQKAWHYVWSDEDSIYYELLSEYEQAAGMGVD